MINNFVLEKVFAKTLSESVGKKSIESMIYIGNKKGSIALKLNLKDHDSILLETEFLRYLVFHSDINFVSFAIKSYVITPEDECNLTDDEIREITNNPEKISTNKYVKESLQLNCESKLGVTLETYIVSKKNGLIVNLKKQDSMTKEGTINSLGLVSITSGFFSGLKTDILVHNPHIEKYYKERMDKLLSQINQ